MKFSNFIFIFLIFLRFLSSLFNSFSFNCYLMHHRRTYEKKILPSQKVLLNCYLMHHRRTYVKKILPSQKVLLNFPPEKNHSITERTLLQKQKNATKSITTIRHVDKIRKKQRKKTEKKNF